MVVAAEFVVVASLSLERAKIVLMKEISILIVVF